METLHFKLGLSLSLIGISLGQFGFGSYGGYGGYGIDPYGWGRGASASASAGRAGAAAGRQFDLFGGYGGGFGGGFGGYDGGYDLWGRKLKDDGFLIGHLDLPKPKGRQFDMFGSPFGPTGFPGYGLPPQPIYGGYGYGYGFDGWGRKAAGQATGRQVCSGPTSCIGLRK